MVYNQYGAQGQQQHQGAPSQQPSQGSYASPVPGVPIKGPVVRPAQGQVITHYEMYQPKVGCCECEGMKQSGIIAIILLLIFFWPLAWIPCVMPECFEQQQRPVYGYHPGSSNQHSAQSNIPVAEPVQGEPVQYPKATQPPIERHVNGDVV